VVELSHWQVIVQVFKIALAQFAQAIGAGPPKGVLLVLDQAGWHRSKELMQTFGIHLHFLPPSSPDQ
jgi:transposase